MLIKQCFHVAVYLDSNLTLFLLTNKYNNQEINNKTLEISSILFVLFWISFYNKYTVYNCAPYSQTNYISIFTLLWNIITNKYIYNKGYQEISDILFVLFYTSFYNKYILYNWPPYSTDNYISIFTLFFNFITNKYTVCLLVYNKHWRQFANYFIN